MAISKRVFLALFSAVLLVAFFINYQDLSLLLKSYIDPAVPIQSPLPHSPAAIQHELDVFSQRCAEMVPAEKIPFTPPYLFLHIPKTAGTSLAQLLKCMSQDDPESYRESGQIPRNDITLNRKILLGHFSWRLVDFFERNKRDPKKAIWMREPVARAISDYFYRKSKAGDDYLWEALAYPIEEWLEKVNIADNLSTQYLSGRYYANDSVSLQIAKDNLERIDFVGLTERWNESLVLLKHFMGWDHLPIPPVAKSNSKKDDLTAEQMDKIRAKNTNDIQLYELAQIKFEKQIDAMGRDRFECEMERFKLSPEQHELQWESTCPGHMYSKSASPSQMNTIDPEKSQSAAATPDGSSSILPSRRAKMRAGDLYKPKESYSSYVRN